MCLMKYANNKGADQPAHPRSLISTFVVRCLDSTICILAISKSFKILASFCSWAGWFECYLVENPLRHVFAWCGSNEKWTCLMCMSYLQEYNSGLGKRQVKHILNGFTLDVSWSMTKPTKSHECPVKTQKIVAQLSNLIIGLYEWRSFGSLAAHRVLREDWSDCELHRLIYIFGYDFVDFVVLWLIL